jgi:hypothetical protein
MQKEYRNISTHVVDLPDGRTLAPGEVAEVEFDEDETEDYNGLREDGLLDFSGPAGPTKAAAAKSSGGSRKAKGEEE